MNLWEELSGPDIQSKPIVSYIRDNNGNKQGMLVAAKCNGEVCFGWSLCCAEDKFDKYDGFTIAEGRLVNNDRMERNYVEEDNIYFRMVGEFLADKSISRDQLPLAPLTFFFEIVPMTVQKYVKDFKERVARYFKNEKFSEVFEYLYVTDIYRDMAKDVDYLFV